MKTKFKPVHVTVRGKILPSIVEDERIFTSSRKLNSYLKMLNKHYTGLEIKMKSFNAN